MMVFYFNARTGNESFLDADGVELPDAVAAIAHAVEVARELLKADERNKRSWRLDVLDNDGRPVSTVPFAWAASSSILMEAQDDAPPSPE